MFRVSLRIVVDASSPVTLPTTSRLAIRPVPQYRIIDKNTMNRRKVNWKFKYKKVNILGFLRMIPTDKSNIISENLFFWTHSLKYCVNELVAFVNQGRLINFYPLHPVYWVFFYTSLKKVLFKKKKSNIIFIVAIELYKKKILCYRLA